MVTLAKNMYPPGEKIDKIAAGYLITPKIPQGLAAAVEGLTREVIRHHPEDIYVFAAQHFEKLLQLREQYSRSMDQQWNVCPNSSVYLDLKDYYKDVSESHNYYHDNKTSSRYTKSNKLQKNEEYLKHKRKKAYGREIKTRSPKVISGITTASKDIKNKLKKNRISTQESKTGVSKNDKVVLVKLDSMDKVKSYVVDKFAQTTSLDGLESMNYTEAVQNVIDNNTQTIYKKIEELKSNKLSTQQSKESIKEFQNNNLNNPSALESRLNETHNLLKDISSCFPKLHSQSRPRSADAVYNYTNYCNASDKLEAMLNETHHLLLGISNNFFRGNEFQKSKSEDNEHSSNIYLPSVQSTSVIISSNSQKNATKNGSSVFPPLPPVTSSSSSPTDSTKSAKVKQDLTLPILLPTPDNSPIKNDEVNEQKQDENNVAEHKDVLQTHEQHDDIQDTDDALKVDEQHDDIQDTDDALKVDEQHDDTQDTDDASEKGVIITEIDDHSRKETPEQLCYMLTSAESPLFEIPYNVTTVIIPDRSSMMREPTDDQCLEDPFSSLMGEVVNATLAPDGMKDLVPTFELAAVMANDKIKFHKQNLQSINEEDISEEFKEESKVILKEITDEEKELFIEEKPILGENLIIDEGNVEEEKVKEKIDEITVVKSEIENYGTENELDSEPSSTTKETSPTDGPLESLVIYEQTETGPSVSKSTDIVESSNEAKETTVTDGVSLLSLDDPVRPYVPELNLDSLQDITVSSFKMTEDECDLHPDDDVDRTNSITETPTLNLNDSRDSDEIPAAEIEAGNSYIIANNMINGDVPDSPTRNKSEVEQPEEDQSTNVIQNLEEDAHELENSQDINESKDLEKTPRDSHNSDQSNGIHEDTDQFEKSKKNSNDADGFKSPDHFQEDVCILENYAPMSRPLSPELDFTIQTVDEPNHEAKMQENEEKKGELTEEQDESSTDDQFQLKAQQTVIMSDEKIPEPDQDQQEHTSVLTDSHKIDPSIEDSIVLETLLTSQESLELHRMEDAVIRIQAVIRGFLTRHQMRKNKIEDAQNVIEKDLAMQSEEKKAESITEPEEQDMMKLQDTAAKTIQNNFRNYQTRRRLYRENAMQKTTTVSREKTYTEEGGLQHTGEFHDCIVLPVHDISLDTELSTHPESDEIEQEVNDTGDGDK